MDEILHLPQEQTNTAHTLSTRLARLREQISQSWEQFRQEHAKTLHWLDGLLDGRKLMRPLPFLAVMSVVGTVAVVGTVYTPSYVVNVDGVDLGVVAEQADFWQVVSLVEARASSILGYNYHLDGEITFRPALTERGQFPDTANFETYLFNQIGDVMKSYVLSVDGTVIGAANTRAEIDHLLDQVKAPYLNEDTVSSTFLSDIQITHAYTPSSVEQNQDRMLEALTANTTGDTTYTIKLREDMTFLHRGGGRHLYGLGFFQRYDNGGDGGP